jgi:hypothetical protein
MKIFYRHPEGMKRERREREIEGKRERKRRERENEGKEGMRIDSPASKTDLAPHASTLPRSLKKSHASTLPRSPKIYV